MRFENFGCDILLRSNHPTRHINPTRRDCQFPPGLHHPLLIMIAHIIFEWLIKADVNGTKILLPTGEMLGR